jgi:3-phenylpropionate/cinnamic acid dioxygenase small subunit
LGGARLAQIFCRFPTNYGQDVTVTDSLAIMDVLTRYARGCDERRWDLFKDVFTEDVVFEAGGVTVVGRDRRIESVRSNLGGCGPTQHLLGNFDITVDGDDATCSVHVRAYHAGAGERSHLHYELLATYHDQLRRTGDGWRIYRRRMQLHIELGTRDVLQPASTDER